MRGLAGAPLAGALSLVLAATMAPPAFAASHGSATPHSGIGHRLAKGMCKSRSFFRVDWLSPRNYFIPRTRFIDGPGGTMTARVEREYRVYAEIEVEREKYKHVNRTKGRTKSQEATARDEERKWHEERRWIETSKTVESTAEEDAVTSTPSPTATTTLGPTPAPTPTTPPDAGTGEETTPTTTTTGVTKGKEHIDGKERNHAHERTHGRERNIAREVLRALRNLVNPLLAEEHIVRAGHEYSHKVSPNRYGNLWYRVYGYRIGFSQWRQVGSCRIKRVTSGIANVPARVEGWKYWETKHPKFRGMRLGPPARQVADTDAGQVAEDEPSGLGRRPQGAVRTQPGSGRAQD
jgi:hypothetical protein